MGWYDLRVLLFSRAAMVCALMWIAAPGLLAQATSVLNYRGHIEVDGKPFDGQGTFTFAILDANGIILWSSGEFPFVGKTNVPVTALRVPVTRGDYTVRLGDTAVGAPALDPTLLRRAIDPRLRVWFNDGSHGWSIVTSGVPLASTLTSTASPAAATSLSGADAEAILRELRELRAKVERQNVAAAPTREPPPQIATVSIGKSPSIGRADAPLVLVEFTDFQCGFCKRFDETTFPELKKNFVDSGKLRIVSRSLPLPFHTNAGPAAVAALCAGAQQQFWTMREKLFSDPANLNAARYLHYAQELKLDPSAFQACVSSKTFDAQVAADAKDAEAVNITGTPTFVLGRLSGDKVTGAIIVGARPYASFEAEINKLLTSTK
jgi:protein-disulfide isomerase